MVASLRLASSAPAGPARLLAGWPAGAGEAALSTNKMRPWQEAKQWQQALLHKLKPVGHHQCTGPSPLTTPRIHDGWSVQQVCKVCKVCIWRTWCTLCDEQMHTLCRLEVSKWTLCADYVHTLPTQLEVAGYSQRHSNSLLQRLFLSCCGAC